MNTCNFCATIRTRAGPYRINDLDVHVEQVRLGPIERIQIDVGNVDHQRKRGAAALKVHQVSQGEQAGVAS
jgi:hypothetical protein